MATLSEDWVRRMGQRALLLEAHHTTHIEGTQLSIEQAQQIWDGKDKRLTLAGCELVLPGTNRRTLQRDLRGLVEGGLIREVGQATDPTRHYLWREL